MSAPLRIGLLGATGRMGQALIRRIAAADDLQLACALVRPGGSGDGQDAGKLAGIGSVGIQAGQALADCDVLVDFSSADALLARLDECVERAIPVVSGTTALNYEQLRALSAAASSIPLFWSSNMSIAVALLQQLAVTAARAFGDSADIEISERHHRYKKDAPSGTAMTLAEALARARGSRPDEVIVRGRSGSDCGREPGEIGVSAIRAGDIVGDHTVLFGLDGETLELTHRAASRDAFADGALRAARWLPGREPGQYGIQDLLKGA